MRKDPSQGAAKDWSERHSRGQREQERPEEQVEDLNAGRQDQEDEEETFQLDVHEKSQFLVNRQAINDRVEDNSRSLVFWTEIIWV